MFKNVLTAITSAVLLLIPSSSPAQGTNAQLTGTVAYRERIALPSDAVIDVQLIDASVADIAAQSIAEALINAEGRQVPVPFTLTYDPVKIDPTHRYSVRATIRSGDGMLMFSTTQAYPVLTHREPSKANLLLHTVGHGAHSGASAKKQTPAPASEGTAATSQSPPRASSESAAVTTTVAPSTEPSPNAMTPGAQEPEKPAAQTEAKPAQSESAGAMPSSTPQELPSSPTTPLSESAAAPPTQESAPSETAPPTSESGKPASAPESAPPTPATTEQQASPSEPPAPAVPEALSTQPESKAAEAPPATSEQTTPPESKTEPTTSAPEAKAAEPETPLPEAPSATKRAELEAATPGTTPESAAESTSRPDRPAPNKALTPLADTQWKLVQLNGQEVVITPPQKPVTLAFSPEGRRIAGSAGCNSYLGAFTDDHGRLHLSPGNMTMMACADPAGSREKKFIAMLRSADAYTISGDFLVLRSNGKTVAKFRNNQE